MHDQGACQMMKTRRGRWMPGIFLGVLVVLVAGGVVWYLVLRSTPRKTLTVTLTAAAERDQETVRRLVTEGSQGMVGSWVSAVSFLAGRGTADDPAWSLGVPEVEGNRATVPVYFELPDSVRGLFGESMTVEHALVREGRVWKVDLKQTLKNLGTSFLGGELLSVPGSAGEEP